MSDLGTEVRFTIRLPHTYCLSSPESILRVAEKAEELGYYGVSVQDHIVADSGVANCGDHHRPEGDDRTVFEALNTLAFVGARTERVKLITGVLVIPVRNPILLAKETASLDIFSGGRLVIGVGVGATPGRKLSEDGGQNLSSHGRVAAMEFDAFQVRGHRGEMTNEAIEVMQAIWTQDAASFHGQHFDFEGLPVFPKPMQAGGPPIWVGGRSEAALRRTVRHGTGWFPSQVSATLYRESLDWMRQFAASEGLPGPAVTATNIFATIAATDAEATAIARRAFGDRFTPEGLATATLVGAPDTVIAQIQNFVDAGVRIFDLKLVPPTLEDTLTALELVAREVVPAFAAEQPAGASA